MMAEAMFIDRREPRVLLDEGDVIALDKPAGWHCVNVSRRGDDVGASVAAAMTIESWLRGRFPELESLEEAGLAHRLDAPTTGCLLAGRTAAAQQTLRERLRSENRVLKRYLAMTSADVPAAGEFELYFSSRYKRSKKVNVRERGGEAQQRGRCQWTLLWHGEARTLLEISLLGPGRRHQIRAGLAHLGWPIIGDTLYGGEAWDGRIALHSWRIAFDRTFIEAPPPEWWNLSAAARDAIDQRTRPARSERT